MAGIAAQMAAMDGTGPNVNSMLYSFLGYIKTGNPMIDYAIVSLAGLIVTKLLFLLSWENLKETFSWIMSLIMPKKKQKYNYVTITLKKIMSSNGNVNVDDIDGFEFNNEKLIDAFYFYMNKNVKNLKQSELAIMFNREHDYWDQIHRDFWVRFRPTQEVKIGDFYIKFESAEDRPEEKPSNGNGNGNNNDSKKYVERKFVKSIMIYSELDTDQIKAFIHKIWLEYVDFTWPKVDRSNQDDTRWYFTRKKLGKNSAYYLRYRLSSPTTFDDIFFQDKEKIIKLIDQFEDGRLKISRFNILLHGPPGTGKSSFIRALHNYTKRHVVEVRLSEFDTLEDLMDTFHNDEIIVSDRILNDNGGKDKKDGTDKLGLRNDCYINRIRTDKRIYVLEDVDAESDIIKKRKSENSDDEDSDSEGDEDEEGKKKKKKKKKSREDEEKTMKKLLAKHDASELDEMEYGPKAPPMAYGPFSAITSSTWFKKLMMEEESKVNLAGILNLLDGVLQLNKCYVILTTNHPDKLDPALIRPGRMTLRLKLGEINVTNMKYLIQKFIADYDPSQPHEVLDPLLEQLPKMMPCDFEEMVIGQYDLEGVIANIQRKIIG